MKNTKSLVRGFTLTEMMVALTVTGLLMTGLMTFFIQSLYSMNASDQRMKLAGQIKRFSNELIVQASRSNQFVLFKSADPADFNGVNTAPTADPDFPDRQFILGNEDDSAALHPAGDFVVFVYYEIPKPTAEPFHRITKLEGYFLSTTTAGDPGKVRRVVIDLSSAPSTSSIEAILTAKWTTSEAVFSDYFPLVRGLAMPTVVDGKAITVLTSPQPPPRLFYMSASRNVIITGQIFGSSKDIDTKDRRTFTNSFCFNITPRT